MFVSRKKYEELEKEVARLADDFDAERVHRSNRDARNYRTTKDLRHRLTALETKRPGVPVVVTQVSPYEWHWRIKGEPQQNGTAHSRELALMEAREAAAEWDRQEVKV